MSIKSAALALTVVAGLVGATSYSPSASAGDVSTAALACYVETFAFDQLSTDYCMSAWTPSTANSPTIAHFEVVGLAPGTYTYTWSRPTCGTGSACNVSIRKDTSPGGVPITLDVTVRDTATGATKTVSATAEFLDVWS